MAEITNLTESACCLPPAAQGLVQDPQTKHLGRSECVIGVIIDKVWWACHRYRKQDQLIARYTLDFESNLQHDGRVIH